MPGCKSRVRASPKRVRAVTKLNFRKVGNKATVTISSGQCPIHRASRWRETFRRSAFGPHAVVRNRAPHLLRNSSRHKSIRIYFCLGLLTAAYAGESLIPSLRLSTFRVKPWGYLFWRLRTEATNGSLLARMTKLESALRVMSVCWRLRRSHGPTSFPTRG
jgi:hypothetical protein